MTSEATSATRSAVDLRLMGARLRAGRRRSGLTVAAAAKASGLSTGFISLMENGKTDATVGRLTQLLQAYEMSISDVVGRDQELAAEPARPEVQPAIAEYVSPQEKLIYRFFDPDGSDLMPVHVLIGPGGGWLDVSVHQGEETIYLLHGRVELHAGDDVVELGAGDRYRVPALAPHSYRAIGEEPVELFAIVRDPLVLDRMGDARRGRPVEEGPHPFRNHPQRAGGPPRTPERTSNTERA